MVRVPVYTVSQLRHTDDIPDDIEIQAPHFVYEVLPDGSYKYIRWFDSEEAASSAVINELNRWYATINPEDILF